MRRLILVTLGLLLLIVVAAVILVPLLLDKDKVLELASNALYEQTGARLAVNGDISLSVFPTLGISLADAAITLPEKTEPDVHVGALQIGVQMMPLFSRQLAIDTFNLNGLTARIEGAEEQPALDTSKLSDAQLDAFYAKRSKAMAEAGDGAGAADALAVPMALNVKRLTITDSQLELVDPATGDATLVKLVRLEASGINLDGRAMPLDVVLQLPGEQMIEVTLQGDIRVDQGSQTANLDGLQVAVTGATAQALNLTTSGVVDLTRQTADLQLDIELGETRGDGTLRYASFESPQIDSTLHLNLFDPALLALAGPEAAAAAADSDSATGDEPLPLDAIRAIDTRAALRIDQARFDAHTIQDLQLNLRAVDGIVQLTGLTGQLHGGKLAARATFNGKHNTATLNTTGSIQALDLATALTAMESTTPITGSADLNWQLSSKGRTSNELTAAMMGPITLATTEVVLQGTSVEKLLCQAVALTNQESLTATFPTSTRFKTLGAKIQVADGKAALQPLRAELPQIALAGSGNFDLLSQDFSATFKASLSPELEELDHACRVSKRLTAISWPVNCVGNVATEPGDWCSVDAEKIIQDLAINEGKRKLEKKASKFLNKLLKKSD